jgi:hypothetical protein
VNNFYRADEARRMLWILPPKNASTKICGTVTLKLVEREVALILNASYFTVGVVRHPFDRAVSALYSACRELTPFAERMRKYKNDSHVRPQWPAFDGVRLDFKIRFEHLHEDWRSLQAIRTLPDLRADIVNAGRYRPRDWRGECDWQEFMPLYEKDFDLCPEWQRP